MAYVQLIYLLRRWFSIAMSIYQRVASKLRGCRVVSSKSGHSKRRSVSSAHSIKGARESWTNMTGSTQQNTAQRTSRYGFVWEATPNPVVYHCFPFKIATLTVSTIFGHTVFSLMSHLLTWPQYLDDTTTFDDWDWNVTFRFFWYYGVTWCNLPVEKSHCWFYLLVCQMPTFVAFLFPWSRQKKTLPVFPWCNPHFLRFTSYTYTLHTCVY